MIVDLTRAMSELERMERGEIPLNVGYLNELVDNSNVSLEIEQTCADCGAAVEWMRCPECAMFDLDDCFLCDGTGGWFDCSGCAELR